MRVVPSSPSSRPPFDRAPSDPPPSVATGPQALYALTTKRDFTAAGALLFTCLLSLLLAGFVGLFVRTSALNLLLGGAGAVLFSCYIVYDVQVRGGGGARGAWHGARDAWRYGSWTGRRGTMQCAQDADG